ncbi:MAG: cupredoxin domain-containing protein [Gaiellaceae bacterium]
MSRTSLALAASAAALALAATAPAAIPKLTGTVGPGFTISLKQGAKKVTTLKPGKYAFAIADKATAHNFHLKGPGVNRTTGVAAKGNRTWTVTLQRGTYRFVCDPHASSMKGSFTVR